MPLASLQIFQDIRVPIPGEAIAAFCAKWCVAEFALFGSVLRSDFRSDSDIDVLVTFDPDARPTLLTLVRMREELRELFGRRVDLLERGGMEQSADPELRRAVMSSMKVIHAQ